MAFDIWTRKDYWALSTLSSRPNTLPIVDCQLPIVGKRTFDQTSRSFCFPRNKSSFKLSKVQENNNGKERVMSKLKKDFRVAMLGAAGGLFASRLEILVRWSMN